MTGRLPRVRVESLLRHIAYAVRGCQQKGVALMTYKVFVDDNYHYMDKDKRYTHGEFAT